jgi:3-oxoacyl-[acyl-carrier-protein] synthase II
MGALTPIGNDVQSFFNGLRSGTSGAGLITHFDTEKFKVKFACEVKNFMAENFFDRKEARKMDPFTQFAMVAADEAIHHSGLLQQSYNRIVWV